MRSERRARRAALTLGTALLGAALLGALALAPPLVFPAQAADGEPWPCLNVKAAPALCGVETYKLNYMLPVTFDQQAPPARQNLEAKFQLSLRKQVYAGSAVAWYLGYTQLSFWQLYDSDNSRPFRETNYNPELFLRWRVPRVQAGPELLQVGAEHESNGQGIATSRSWNRVYLQPEWGNPHADAWAGSLKLWQRIEEPPKSSPSDATGDDNPAIESYEGYAEARLYRRGESYRAQLTVRRGSRDASGFGQLDWLWPIGAPQSGLSAMVQVFYGYGESLIDFNRLVSRVGVGISFE